MGKIGNVYKGSTNFCDCHKMFEAKEAFELWIFECQLSDANVASSFAATMCVCVCVCVRFYSLYKRLQFLWAEKASGYEHDIVAFLFWSVLAVISF